MHVNRKTHEIIVKLISRPDQALKNMLFERLERQMLFQFGKILDPPRENRIRRLDRFDE